MAGVIARSSFQLAKRPNLTIGFIRCKGKMMPDPIEHATGLERKELEAIARGNPDPFGMLPRKRHAGGKDNPNLVPSFHDKRMIGCICHDDAFFINYLWLYKGEARRCECGYWFKLTEAKDPFKFD